MTAAAPLKNVAVFGAGGTNIGHHVVKALASNPDEFTVSIIARKSTKSQFQPRVQIHYVDDSLPHDQLVAALHGQDALVSAIGFSAIALEEKLIAAAVEAGVKRFLPSEYGVNNTYPPARALCPVFDAKGAVIDLLREKEETGLTWTAVPNGLWLDW
ncbi:saccharopine dehydrogenase [Capronia coronata CBS 617.96]|uniref:Saccharopine dehydrogenase n=1 Tax=Capronia coronata CBS 617.96 TaxID=1182541 RepID=W9Z135_9EURO|nr:saccharopine dehydrogenase [Capronia coronata CBS 617.96]EXJ95291.1 saccharopine dehydrogenase [Capronia coronata CBS 617.96]